MNESPTRKTSLRLLRLVPILLGSSSIIPLLLYFQGLFPFRDGIILILIPSAVALVLFMLWLKRNEQEILYNRMLAGLWAGSLATLAYDLVRVPVVWSGVPVFKAISYFGTVIMGQSHPSLTSEILGWTYHLSNGVGFALLYATAVSVPRWWTAVGWGVILELGMLSTPYAEVFDYQISFPFLVLTISAHVVYGMVLWATLRWWGHMTIVGDRSIRVGLRPLLVWFMVPLAMGATAADAYHRHADRLRTSPPGDLGPHLYTTWGVLEPDRLVALWVQKRFVDPRARFHFVEPFSTVHVGIPFDTPEAPIRRRMDNSVTERILEEAELADHEALARLARMTHVYEVTPWLRPSKPGLNRLGMDVMAEAGSCESPKIRPCVNRAFQFLDRWYKEQAGTPPAGLR